MLPVKRPCSELFNEQLAMALRIAGTVRAEKVAGRYAVPSEDGKTHSVDIQVEGKGQVRGGCTCGTAAVCQHILAVLVRVNALYALDAGRRT